MRHGPSRVNGSLPDTCYIGGWSESPHVDLPLRLVGCLVEEKAFVRPEFNIDRWVTRWPREIDASLSSSSTR